MFDYLVVGAGFSGCTLAERIATQLGKRVLIVDRRNHLGGNAYDEYDDNGVLLHRYGPHIFHTSSEKVWRYLSQFTDWRPYFHHVLGVIDGKKVPLPFNLNSIYALFSPRYAAKLEDQLLAKYGFGTKVPILRLREEKSELRTLADYIYRNVFHGYTIKQWDLEPEQLDAAVTGRVPVYVSRDDRYFQDKFQAMPLRGYTEMFRRMTDHPNIKVLLNTDYKEVLDSIRFDRMIYTGPLDAFFDYRHGALPYRSIRFDFRTVDQEYYQEVGTVNYPNDYDFTRITEQKYLSGQKTPKSTLVVEHPEAYVIGKNDPYYPIPREENRDLCAKYLADADALHSVHFVGRLADYKYYNMDQACARALKVFEDDIATEPALVPVAVAS